MCSFCSNDSETIEKLGRDDDVFERIKEESFSNSDLSVRDLTESSEEKDLDMEQQGTTFNKEALQIMSSEDLLGQLRKPQAMNKEVFILELLIKREGMSCLTPDGSLCELLEKLYCKAGRVQDWNVIRHCSGLLRKIVDSLAPAISTILVHGKVVSLGCLYLIFVHIFLSL